MRAHVVTPTSRFLGETCPICEQDAELGHALLVLDQGINAYVHRELAFHRGCVAAVLAATPPDQDEVARAFAEIADHIAETGMSPVEAILA